MDCQRDGVTTDRPIVSGVRKPRCATHERTRVKRSQVHAHGRMVQRQYNLTPEMYWALYEAQGGKCGVCERATGATKRLAVDHDHKTGQVFGLLCGPCNVLLGRLGRKPDPYVRVLEYLHHPTAMRVFGECPIVPSMDVDTRENPEAGVRPTITAGGELERSLILPLGQIGVRR